jgi:hypothetical protein
MKLTLSGSIRTPEAGARAELSESEFHESVSGRVLNPWPLLGERVPDNHIQAQRAS